MIITKAKIQQSISLSDEDLDRLSRVAGNVYIINSNNGSIATKTDFTFAGCVKDLYDSGLSFRDILVGVRKGLIELALQEYKTPTLAAERLGMQRRLIYYHLPPNKKGPDKNAQAV